MAINVCPKCGSPLTLRIRKSDKHEFWGCSQYPSCRYTEPLPACLEMRKQNAPILPGFEEVAQ